MVREIMGADVDYHSAKLQTIREDTTLCKVI